MSNDGRDGVVAENGRKEGNPLEKHSTSLGVENARADAEQDGRTCLVRRRFQA